MLNFKEWDPTCIWELKYQTSLLYISFSNYVNFESSPEFAFQMEHTNTVFWIFEMLRI